VRSKQRPSAIAQVNPDRKTQISVASLNPNQSRFVWKLGIDRHVVDEDGHQGKTAARISLRITC